jgi:hypothetical protein
MNSKNHKKQSLPLQKQTEISSSPEKNRKVSIKLKKKTLIKL